jgi:hypothetical protein
VYCGFVFDHYGHFLIETLSRLWWPIQRSTERKLIFQIEIGKTLPLFVLDILKILRSDYDVIITSDCVRVKDLVVPSPSFQHMAWASTAHKRIFNYLEKKVAANHPVIHSRKALYVSRAKLKVGLAFGEVELQNAYCRQGFSIIYPEDLSIYDQILAFARAERVSGVQGSAMHNVLFSRAALTTTFLRRADFSTIHPTYLACDAISQCSARYIAAIHRYQLPRPTAKYPYLLDLEKINKVAHVLGISEFSFEAAKKSAVQYLHCWMQQHGRMLKQNGDQAYRYHLNASRLLK